MYLRRIPLTFEYEIWLFFSCILSRGARADRAVPLYKEILLGYLLAISRSFSVCRIDLSLIVRKRNLYNAFILAST